MQTENDDTDDTTTEVALTRETYEKIIAETEGDSAEAHNGEWVATHYDKNSEKTYRVFWFFNEDEFPEIFAEDGERAGLWEDLPWDFAHCTRIIQWGCREICRYAPDYVYTRGHN